MHGQTVKGSISRWHFVVLQDGTGTSTDLGDTLKDHVKAKIGMWKYPRWIEIVEELPKNSNWQDPAIQTAFELIVQQIDWNDGGTARITVDGGRA